VPQRNTCASWTVKGTQKAPSEEARYAEHRHPIRCHRDRTLAHSWQRHLRASNLSPKLDEKQVPVIAKEDI
jgi:hypothetical protein